MTRAGPIRRAGLSALAAVSYHVIRCLSVRQASELMAFVVSRLVPFVVKGDRMAKNLARAFPHLERDETRSLSRRISENFGRLLAEIVHIPAFAASAGGTRLTLTAASRQTFEQTSQAIFVSAHLGNWELAPILFTRYGRRLTLIYSKLGIDPIDDRLLALRRQTGQTYVEKAHGVRACVQALRRGESIALLADQSVLSGIEVDFFGRPTVFTHLPARMALRFGVPIIVCECVRTGPGQMRVTLQEPIRPGPGRGEVAERALTQRMARAIEDAICRHPEQWFCNKRRWRKSSETISAAEPVSAATPA